MSAAVLNQDNPNHTLSLGGYALNISLRRQSQLSSVADTRYVLAVADQADHFTVAGKDVEITFVVGETPSEPVELSKVEAVVLQEGPGCLIDG